MNHYCLNMLCIPKEKKLLQPDNCNILSKTNTISSYTFTISYKLPQMNNYLTMEYN